MISCSNGRFGNTSIVPIAVFQTCVKSQSDSALTSINLPVSVLASILPSGLGGVVACSVERINRGMFSASFVMVIDSAIPPFYLSHFSPPSLLITEVIFGTGVES